MNFSIFYEFWREISIIPFDNAAVSFVFFNNYKNIINYRNQY